MTSCHVSDQWNKGPLTAQTTITNVARRKALGRPAAVATLLAAPSNQSIIIASLDLAAIATRGNAGEAIGDPVQRQSRAVLCAGCMAGAIDFDPANPLMMLTQRPRVGPRHRWGNELIL